MPIEIGEVETTVDVRGGEEGRGGGSVPAPAAHEVHEPEPRFRARLMRDRLAEEDERLAAADRDD